MLPCRQLWSCLLVAVPVPVPLPERGARFHVTMPLHMIVMDGMVVRVGDVNYFIPIDTILRIQQSDGSSVLKLSAKSGQAMLEIDNQDHVPIHHLSGADVSGKVEDQPAQVTSVKEKACRQKQSTFVIVRNDNYQMAIPVDELMGQQLVLLRPLRGVMSRIPDLSGVALLAGGEVGMVLAVNRMLAA
jgi:two-component system chemotaxis sensor kinase CheA